MKDTSPICQEAIFRKVYEEQADATRRFLYYKFGAVDQADDLVQDAFIKLWENCGKVPLAKAQSFLFTVINNLRLNVAKHQQVVLNFRQRVSVNKIEREDPQFQLEQQEFQARLQRAINQLPERERIVFLMNRIDKMTYKEIAASLDISPKTVEKRMQKALLAMHRLSKKI